MAEEKQKKDRGRRAMNIKERKGGKIIYGGYYYPICVYVEESLLERMAKAKKYGWSRREIIEEGIKKMLDEIEKKQKKEEEEEKEHGIIL